MQQKHIQVWADWEALSQPTLMGTLSISVSRGKEIFSFAYAPSWLKAGLREKLDPNLEFYEGPQYPRENQPNFGLFLDSSPDRWGRVLMRRREEQSAREQNRASRTLLESDYLLGVHDGQRMGALRFRQSEDDPFLDHNSEMASPPWAHLRELEHASLQLEKDHAEKNQDYMKWLKLLIAPGGSLGGARPKAGVIDEHGHLWIAKFPSGQDDQNIGAWEYVVHQLAIEAGIRTASAQIQRFTGQHDTFLTKRFDRTGDGQRIHFASAMTLLNRIDGATDGASYLDLVDFLIKQGSQTNVDLEELWTRIIFNICVSNVDDHLRNHGFLLTSKGWQLAPAYDMNPVETGNGLTLNISQDDNSQDLAHAKDVAKFFRLKSTQAEKIAKQVIMAVKGWRQVATRCGIPEREISRMKNAFRVAENS